MAFTCCIKNDNMKKIFLSVAMIFVIGVVAANAQETKVKPVTTPADKVHNVVHPKHKIQHGTKYKHKTATGKKTTTVVRKPKAEAMDHKKKEEKKMK